MNSRIIVSLLFPVWLLFPPLNTISEDWTVEESTAVAFDDIEKRFYACIEKGDLLTPSGASAYDQYLLFMEVQPKNYKTQRSLKRTLVMNLIEAADQWLILYIQHEGRFLQKSEFEDIKYLPMDEYYAVAADLLGEEDYLYIGLLAKSLFLEALRLRYIEQANDDFIKTQLEKSISIDPSASFAYNELGHVYTVHGDYSAACDQFRLAIKWNPNWKMPRQNLQTAEAALPGSQKK